MPITRPLTVLVSSTSSDSHTWNLVFLQLLLEELGHEVANLGACVPPPLLAAECAARRPDLVVLSTVNGHGAHDGPIALAALRADPATASVPVVIGGKLGVRGQDTWVAEDLLAAGFAAVFDGPDETDRFSAFLTALAEPAPALARSSR